MSLQRLSILVILTLIALTGCTDSPAITSESEIIVADATPVLTAASPAITHTPSLTPTLMATTEPSPSLTPRLTATAKPFPTKIASAITASPIPTPTYLPTISPEQRGQVYSDLILHNADCTLPCWWGFELGKSTSAEVQSLYSSLGALITVRGFDSGRSRITVLFEDPQIENGIQVRHTFRAKDGVVIEAEIEIIWHPNYQIETILKRLGLPDEVWLWTIPYAREGLLPVSLLLYYSERGVLISYGITGERKEAIVQACFNGLGGVILGLWEPLIWNPNGDKGFIERANESSELTLEGHLPVDEVSNWDAERFYNVLSDPGHTECLETPAELWPEP